MTSTTNSIKQRKLSDLRVIDLQRELRSFNISYDKKELKGVLIEKLRQALINRNLDPDNYLFDASTDLKSISSDENNRNLEENGSNEINTFETSTMETESDQQLNLDYPVQTNSSKQNEGDSEPTEQINRLDSRENNNGDDDDENIFLTIDQSTTKQDEDENNNHNEILERNFTEQYQTSNENFDDNSQSNGINSTFNDNSNDQQISNDQQHVSQTTNISTDNDNLSKSENDQTKSKNINKDQCHLWVSNIAKETHASHLKDLFSKYGKVLTTKVIGSSSSRWFGYINLATPDDVEKCINALHQTELHGKKIYVDREMHDEPLRSSSSSSSNTHRKPSDEHSSSSSREKEKRSSNSDTINSSTKRSASSSSNDNRKKVSSYETNKRSSDSYDKTRTSSSSSSSHTSKSISQDKQSDQPKSKTSSSPSTHRSRSRETSDRHRSSSIDQSKKYDKPKDTHRPHYDKDVLERKQYVHHQEEKIKEEQRRLAEERERVRREYELLERERLNIERTRAALQKEKQDQAREIEKQQRRLADEVKHRHEIEDKIRDEKLQRLAHSDNKRSRSSSHRDSQRSHHSNSTNNSSNNSNKGYDHRSSSNSLNERDRDRSLNERNRDYYPEPKRQYTENSNNQREPIFRDRPNYRDSDLSGPSSSSFGPNSSSSSTNNNQRYMASSSNQHRISDPFGTLPLRGRDMALPPTSSVSTAYDRSSRNTNSASTNPNAIPRRPHSRERFDNREYLQQAQRRDRSPIPSTNPLRREPIDSSHWDRSKSRDTHYNDDGHKYLPSQYLSESSQSSQQQGLWSAAPPSRQSHHHSDLPGKTGSHAPVVDPYNWQRVSQQGPPQSHHPSSLSSSHDRSRNNLPSNQRMPILPSNQQPPPPPPPPSSRGGTTGQTHLYSHTGVPLNTLPTSQQHTSLAAPPPSLRHPTTYLTQQTSPTGLVLHPPGQTRPYEQHYVVAPSLSQRRF